MARRKSTPATEAEATTDPTTTPEEESVTTTTESPDEANENTTDLTAFKAAVDEAIENRDESTGDIAEAYLARIKEAFNSPEVKGVKAKNEAREIVDEGMKSAMGDSDIVLARAYLAIQKEALVATGGASASKERVPADPTEAFIQLVSGLRLAITLASENVPEGVAEDWADRAKANVAEATEAAQAIFAYDTSEEPEGDRPEAEGWVQAAVKLALGKSARVGGTRRAAGGTYSGPRRNVQAHIEQAFADKEPGTFLRVSEIVNFKSEEYGDQHPSPGAVSQRLKSENFTSETVSPTTDESGKLGAVRL